jgi:hypothetical protein
MDRLVRAMIVNWFGGMIAGLVCAGLVLAFDVMGIRALLWSSDVFLAGTITLFASFAFSFGGVVCAAAVMRFGSDEDKPPRGRRSRAKPSARALAVSPSLNPPQTGAP